MSKIKISLFAFFITILVIFSYQYVKANVELVSFTATSQENSIKIEWETATELDNAGFIVQRSEDEVLGFEDYSPFILARGSGAVGANYEFLDEDVFEGITYYYKLQAWDFNNTFQIFGPISATIDGPTTLTPSPTVDISETETPTRTSTPNKSRTPTRTLRPTNTPRPTNTLQPTRTFTPTYTPTFVTLTSTITPTATITPSPTLVDPPEIVINFPVTETPIWTSTPINTLQPLPTLTLSSENPLSNLVESGSFLPIVAICLVVLIWAAIAVGIFIYLQTRNS